MFLLKFNRRDIQLALREVGLGQCWEGYFGNVTVYRLQVTLFKNVISSVTISITCNCNVTDYI